MGTHPVLAALLCWTASLISVERTIDGDTFRADLQIWPKVTITETVRVLGIDSPEHAEIQKWVAARLYTEQWLRESGQTTVTVCKYDSFGRALGTVVSRTKGDLAAALLAAGHAVPYRP